MSLQGPIVVVADNPCGELAEALAAAGAFPIVEATWADAPTAFVSVKPVAVVIAEPGPPSSESCARMLCLQIATAAGPGAPVIARVGDDQDLPVPIALAVDAAAPAAELIARLRAALRVRALHSTVLRRIETFGAERAALPELPVGDPLDDATVMIIGRGHSAYGPVIGERFGMIGAMTVEAAAGHLGARDINGILIADGVDDETAATFLTALAEDDRFRTLPVSMGDCAGLNDSPLDIDRCTGRPSTVVARMIPKLRLHAFELRLKRMLAALDSEGLIDPATGLLAREHFWRELNKAVQGSLQQGTALSLGKFSFDGDVPERAVAASARLVTRLTRDGDFACRDDDGSILIAFGQTDLGSAHLIARRIAAVLKNAMTTRGAVTANVVLATLKASDTLDSLLMRVNGGQVVAAE